MSYRDIEIDLNIESFRSKTLDVNLSKPSRKNPDSINQPVFNNLKPIM